MKYFDRYVQLIEEGKIVICEDVRLAIERVQRFKKQYKFYQDKVDKKIKFIENECSNTKGLNSALKLALPQKVWLEVAWGFYHDVQIEKINEETMEKYVKVEERRLINQNALIVSRGTGKTTMGSAIGQVGLMADGEYGADVQLLAYNREQAGYLFNASRAMTNRKGTLLNLLQEEELLRSTKQGLKFEPTNSLMSIKTSDYESLDGTNSHYNIFDEIHTYDDDFIDIVNTGSSRKRKNWITWYISTNGTKRDKIFDKYLDIWRKILRGQIVDDSIMPWIYQLDMPEEINDESKWQKAIPMLGITIEIEDIRKDIEMAKNDPAKQAELMAKTFNLPVNNYLSYFTNSECKGNRELFNFDIFIGNDERKARCVLGGDLSDVNDICSFTFMIVNGEERHFHNLKYMPRNRIENLPREQKEKYLEWESKGLLHIHEKDHNDQEYIFNDLKKFIDENKILPVKIGIDKWNSREIERYFKNYYGNIVEIIEQTTKVLSNPLKIYKAKMKSKSIIFDDEVSSWCHANVKVKIDGNGNIFPNREKAKEKIDVFASQLFAFLTYEKYKNELSFYFN